ncbi:DUF3718 domain-containing protein [Paraneptunicella aestuarii]|uniref:DUF3718 domain-containing protein n=1 Tax=Paraneptunicella aestuarii TaxID=2831148 RepID=UPI001E50900C|nr:DUF3718 domain-containing protein [Paraneptunicella aestuarii]UAA38389.1 DUF3718 domain-containing protein [Paraneptunicella aestuarii]
MSKLYLKLALAGVIFGLSCPSMADPSLELANICTIIKNNDKSELRKKLKKVQKEYKLKLSDFYAGISCEGNSMIRHAMSTSASDAGEYLVSQMRKSDLEQAESDGKTILQWAEENGHIASPVGSALVSRING